MKAKGLAIAAWIWPWACAMPAWSASGQVPPEFVGDWVAAGARCDAPVRLRLQPDAVSLVDARGQARYPEPDLCLSCEGGSRYAGNVIWLTARSGSDRAPFTVYLNADETPGRVRIDIADAALRREYPLQGGALRRCATPAADDRRAPAASAEPAGIPQAFHGEWSAAGTCDARRRDDVGEGAPFRIGARTFGDYGIHCQARGVRQAAADTVSIDADCTLEGDEASEARSVTLRKRGDRLSARFQLVQPEAGIDPEFIDYTVEYARCR